MKKKQVRVEQNVQKALCKVNKVFIKSVVEFLECDQLENGTELENYNCFFNRLREGVASMRRRLVQELEKEKPAK